MYHLHKPSLVPRPHLLTGKRVWWLLSDFLVVLSQQSWFGQSNEIVSRLPSMHINQWNRSYIVQACNQRNQYCWVITTKKSLIVTRPFCPWEGGVWARDYHKPCTGHMDTAWLPQTLVANRTSLLGAQNLLSSSRVIIHLARSLGLWAPGLAHEQKRKYYFWSGCVMHTPATCLSFHINMLVTSINVC